MPTDGSSGSSASPERASSPSRWASASAPSSSTTPRRAERAGGKAGEPAPIELHPPPWYDAAMRVTTWAEYGLIVSLSLAKRAGEGPVAARELAEQERLPHDYVEQILLRLRRARLVDSVRGVKGGDHPARPPPNISVKDGIEAPEHATFQGNLRLHPVHPPRFRPDPAWPIPPGLA